MRSAIIAAAFAATVIAVPLENRAVVTNTDVEMVYVTDIVTVTRGAAEAAATTQDSNNGGWGHHWWGGGHNHHKHKHTKQPQTQPTDTWTTEQPTASAPPATSEAPPATSETWAEPSQTKKSAPASAPTGYSAIALHHHNIHRSNHTAPAFTWDESLVASAQQIAESCVYAHNTDAAGGGYGQNIAAGVDGDGIDRIITDMFYDSEVGYFDGLYGNPNPPNFESWGHFSQIVWANTESVGCFTQHCPGGLANTGSNVPPYFTVCNYKPPGNVAGQYGNMIHKSIGQPSVVV